MKANLVAEGKSEITIEGIKNSVTWTAVRGYWDGCNKEHGCNGCGLGIKAVDREKLNHNQQIAAPL